MVETIDCLDEIQTLLNPCSLEVTGSTLVVGCYQLEETSSQTATDRTENDETAIPLPCKEDARSDVPVDENAEEKEPVGAASLATATRSGELRLYSIAPTTSSPKFGEPVQVLPMESGVLDAKWCPPIANARYLASACASGCIHVHKLATEMEKDSTSDLRSRLQLVSSSSIRPDDVHVQSTRLALSLDWEKRSEDSDEADSSIMHRKILSSYSDGSLAIQSFDSESPSLVEEERWDAHALFGCPSEVWTCCFAASATTGQSAVSNDGTNVVISGGDDCIMKLWDVRSHLSQPTTKIGNDEFDAGVTAVSYHPTMEHVFAVGSYDEVVRLYDIRTLRDPLCRVSVGGGVWRIRWHPNSDNKILVGAMHGGCRVVTFDELAGNGLKDSCVEARIQSEFTKHESMAYGADWLIIDDGGKVACEYAASCSFYDRRVCLWKSTNAY